MGRERITLNCVGKAKWIFTWMGASIIHLMLGNMYSISNLSKYLASLMIVRYEQDITISSFTRVVAAMMKTMLLGLTMTYILEKCMSVKKVLFVGFIIYSMGIVASALYQDSFETYLMSQGYLVGIAKGILYILPIKLTGQWYPERKGLTSGFILACFGLSPVLFNTLQFFMINPKNLEPSYYPGYTRGKLYTSDLLLDNLEDYLKMLALVQVIAIFIGWFLISDSKQKKKYEKREYVFGDPESIKDDDEKVQGKLALTEDPNTVYVKNYDISIVNFLLLTPVYKYLVIFIVNNILMLYISTNYTMGYGADLYSDAITTTIGTIGAICNSLGRAIVGYCCDIIPTYILMQIIFITWLVSLIMQATLATYGSGIFFGIANCIGFFALGGFMSLNVFLQMETVGPQNMLMYSIILQIGQSIGVTIATEVIDYFYSVLNDKLAFLFVLMVPVVIVLILLYYWGKTVTDPYVGKRSRFEITDENKGDEEEKKPLEIPLKEIASGKCTSI